MKIDTFYVVQIKKNGEDIVAIDYPKDLPILIVGDLIRILDPMKHEHSGIVLARKITITETYREITFTVDCT